MATLTVPPSVPSPVEDCEQLRKAFAGWGTNEKLIISILAHRNASQRRLIRQKYVEIYGEELLKALDKELSGDFERAVFLWTLDPSERDAVLANESIRKLPASNVTIIEIAVSRTSHELFLTRQAYHARFKRSLEEDIASHTTGDFRKLLIPLVSAYRYEGTEVNLRLAKSEAHILHEKFGEKEFSHEEVIRILTTRSKAQLNATFNTYMDNFGHGINKDLSPDSDDAFLSALRTVIKCICCPETHFEEVLRHAINKLGTDEGDLTRIITTRAEVDLHSIKEAYYKRNSVPLDRAIMSDTSGDYEDFLLALLGHST